MEKEGRIGGEMVIEKSLLLPAYNRNRTVTFAGDCARPPD